MSHKLYWVSPGSGRSWRNFALMKCWSLRRSFDGTTDWGTVWSSWGGLQDQRTNDITTDCEHHLLSKPIADLNIWIKMTHHMLIPFVRKNTSKEIEGQHFFTKGGCISLYQTLFLFLFFLQMTWRSYDPYVSLFIWFFLYWSRMSIASFFF